MTIRSLNYGCWILVGYPPLRLVATVLRRLANCNIVHVRAERPAKMEAQLTKRYKLR
jgi:hypothetical protein